MPLALVDSSSHIRRAVFATAGIGLAGISAYAVVAALQRTWTLTKRGKRRKGSRLAGSSQAGISWNEISVNNNLDSIWIVLHGDVYDVTSWVNEHPGGNALLLAFAGMDATDLFDSMGHSTIAKKKLKELFIGSVIDVKSMGDTASTTFTHDAINRDAHRYRRNTRSIAIPTANHSAPFFQKEEKRLGPLWEVKERGFLPNRDPAGLDSLHGTAFEAFAHLAEKLPGLAVTGAFRKYLHSDKELQNVLRKCTSEEVEKLDEAQLERAFSVCGFINSAYWRGGTHKYGNGVVNNVDAMQEVVAEETIDMIPEFLAVPMLAICKKLKRPPMVDYAATVLYNWERLDPHGPIVASNIRCPLRLTGLSDEEWFFKTHVIIECEAAPAISAMAEMVEADDDSTLLKKLISLEEALWRVVRACMPLMYERAEDGISRCNEHIFYAIIRPLISTGRIRFEGDTETDGPRMLHGPSGAMSSLMPAVDAVLGVKMSSNKLREALDLFSKSMPLEHQEFLRKLRGHQNVRDRILFSRPIAGTEGDMKEQHEALVRAFNRCISRVLDFRWQHWQYVKNFIMKPGNLSYALGTGGTSFDYLQQHITDTEKTRLDERPAEGYTGIQTPLHQDEEIHLPSVNPGSWPARQPLGYWSVDGPNGLLAAEPMLRLEDWDAWKQSMPEQLHKAVSTLIELTARLPFFCLTEGLVYTRCEQAKDKLSALRQESLIVGLSEVNRERMLTLLCHIAAGCRGTSPQKKAPKCIERPLQVASRLSGRSPFTDVVALVLANWSRADTDHSGKLSRDGETEHLRNICGFIACPDEEWYRSVHIVLHQQARDAVAIIRAGQNALLLQDDRAIVRSMDQLTAWMKKFCDYFDAHFEQKDSRTEAVMLKRFSKVLQLGEDRSSEETTAWWVYCSGSSVLLPMLHAFLGIPMGLASSPAEFKDSPDLERVGRCLQNWIEEMPLHMPIPHRAFLDELKARGGNLRQYCIKRFGAKAITVELLHDIEVAYNEALNALIRFLSRRMHLVVRFMPHVASIFEAMHSHLTAAVRRNRLQLLKMRQRVDICFEK
jgi:indoleamine 2,3-dioxygenase